MVNRFTKHNLTWLWQQCVHIHNQNMYYHIGNKFYGDLQNVHEFISQVQNQISTIKILLPQ